MNFEHLPPGETATMLRRAFAACAVITLCFATAAMGAGLLFIEDLTGTLERIGQDNDVPVISTPEIELGDVGGPRTLLILGSDRRFDDKKLGLDPRSDTILLVRIDPDQDSIAVMNLPRDLKVEIPGVGIAKINYAFERGGPTKTLETIKHLFRSAGERIEINHLLEINFSGFQRAVNKMGCVYVDIDRRYFNDNSTGENYATIDLQPGYQELCGSDALDYVRYRHKDTDFVRSARQQDFLRQLRQQPRVQRFLTFDNRKEIIELFGRYVSHDDTLLKRRQLLALLRLVLFSESKTIRQVKFRAYIPEGPFDPLTPAYVEVTEEGIQKSLDEFLNEPPAPRKPSSDKKKKSSRSDALPRGVEDARDLVRPYFDLRHEIDFPMYLPRLRSSGATYAGDALRTYSLRDDKGNLHRAYRLTVKRRGLGEYYGLQGTTWRDPPILSRPDETRRVAGKTLRIFRDGRRIRLVSWVTDTAAYWVTNTLERKMSNAQMLAIAGSLARGR